MSNTFINRLYAWGSRQQAKMAGLEPKTVRVQAVECSYYQGIFVGPPPKAVSPAAQARAPAPASASASSSTAPARKAEQEEFTDLEKEMGSTDQQQQQQQQESEDEQKHQSTAAAAPTGGRTQTILYIHGIGAEKDNWVPALQGMARRPAVRKWLRTPGAGETQPRSLRILVPDLPGHGKSTRDKNDLHGISRNVAFLMEFMHAVGADDEPFHVVGHSMGGHIAGVLAADHADKVKSLILAAPAGFDTPTPSEYFADLYLVAEKLLAEGQIRIRDSPSHAASASASAHTEPAVGGHAASAVAVTHVDASSSVSPSAPASSSAESAAAKETAAAPAAAAPAADTEKPKLEMSTATLSRIDISGANFHNKLVPRNIEECRQFVHLLFHRPPPLPRAVLRFMLDHFLIPADFLTLYFANMVEQAGHLQARMHRIICPTLVVWGDKDKILHVSGADVLKKAIGDKCKVVIIPNCGHVISIESPSRFKQAQDEFLGQNFD